MQVLQISLILITPFRGNQTIFLRYKWVSAKNCLNNHHEHIISGTEIHQRINEICILLKIIEWDWREEAEKFNFIIKVNYINLLNQIQFPFRTWSLYKSCVASEKDPSLPEFCSHSIETRPIYSRSNKVYISINNMFSLKFPKMYIISNSVILTSSYS